VNPEPIGPIADEAAKLFAAARNWADEHPTPCGYCPVCQLIAALQAERPELGDKLIQAADVVADAVRTLARAFAASRTGVAEGPVNADASTVETEPPARPRVQHIEIS
jgi:hypothetical protein